MLRSLMLLFLATALTQASVTYIVPHYTIREGWLNSLVLRMNGDLTNETLKVTAFSDQGQFLGVTMYQINEPNPSEDLRTMFEAAGVDQGWLEIEAPLEASGTYRYLSLDAFTGIVHTPLWVPTRSLDLGLAAEGDGTVNGLALCNPNNHPITVTLSLAGEATEPVQLELAARAKYRGIPASLFGSALAEARRLRLRADAPFSAIGLAFKPNALEALPYDYDATGIADVFAGLAKGEPQGWGRAIAVHLPGQETVSLRQGSGDERALSPDHAMELGSGAEPMVAALFMLYQEQGLINLNQDISSFFPSLTRANQIRIRHLLNHESGLADFRTANEYPALWAQALIGHLPTTPDQLLALARTQGEDGYVGGRLNSATNYLLLAEIVRQLTGHSLAEELRSRIFTPLNMTHTFVASEEDVPQRAFAFTFHEGQLLETTRNLDDSWYGTAYSIVTTPEDNLNFMRRLFGGQLLGPQSMQEMIPPLGEFSSSEGFGFFRFGFPDDLTTSIAFNRGINGNALLAFHDKLDAGFAVQCVDGRYGAELFSKLLSWMTEFLPNRIQP